MSNLVFQWPKSGFRLEIESLLVARGDRVFLSAPSGGGKSTLLGLMAGILAPETGSVSIGGRPLSALPPSARDRLRGESIGVIFQQFNLVPYLTAIDNVLLPLRLNPGRRERAERIEKEAGDSGPGWAEAAAGGLLSRLGLGRDVWRRPSSTLSVGQSQRVAAARALIGRPPLILADEPTSALDEDAREAFLKILIFECRAAGAGLIFASHDRRLASEFGKEARLSRRGEGVFLEEAPLAPDSSSGPLAGKEEKGEAPL
ncbi:MAG: ATP-binding cassette domain-containing protein [Deltaproteobacteria bacterium]|nr:ATP-binding cassette domain-containing protein [Deltaproteobacteria bacterium]